MQPQIPYNNTGIKHKIWIGKTTQHAPRIKVDNPSNSICARDPNGIRINRDFSIPLIRPFYTVHGVGISNRDLLKIYEQLEINFDTLLDLSRALNADEFESVKNYMRVLRPIK